MPHRVASAVYRGYEPGSGDQTKTVIASPAASPYKFFRSVMEASLQAWIIGRNFQKMGLSW